MKLYDLGLSGNCYKVRLFAALAGISLDEVEVDFMAGEHKRTPLIDLNPWGELPILQDFLDLEAGLLGLRPLGTALAQADGDLAAGILQVLGVSMALRAVANDGDLLALDQGEVGVLVVIDFHGSPFSGSNWVQTLRMRSPRPMPLTPVRTVSRIRPVSMALMNESSLLLEPVSSTT